MDAELILYCSDACGRVHARAPLSVHPVAVVSDPLLTIQRHVVDCRRYRVLVRAVARAHLATMPPAWASPGLSFLARVLAPLV